MHILSALESVKAQIGDIDPIKVYGHVISVKGIIIECTGISKSVVIGSRCLVEREFHDMKHVLCEVVGFKDDIIMLMPFGDTDGIKAGASVEVCNHENYVKPDLSWAGRIINAFGEPIDEKGPLNSGYEPYYLKAKAPNSQSRNILGSKIELGVKSIDTFASCCLGQRMGIFAGSGVGKSVLISMLTKYSNFDFKVIGLVGERSREVKEFIHEYLGTEGLKNTVIVVATGDEPPLIRKRAAYLTVSIAEYFRDQGKEVLCIIDSITRFAMAQREIGLAVGEPPTSKGYTPSVFSELPQLLERAGPGVNDTSITGLFTVLVEGDDHNEPISDATRSILDGHIVLDRKIAERGRYPAVNVLKSVSRALPKCNTEEENTLINKGKKFLSIYDDMSELIRIGAYKAGSNKEVDDAIKYYNKLEEFFRQNPEESNSLQESYSKLKEILSS